MRAVIALSLAVASGAWTRAQTTVAGPGGEEGLSAARRDFETVKALTQGTPSAPAASLPQIDTPALDTGSVGAPPPAGSAAAQKQQTKSGKDRKSANWLVDAMYPELSTPRATGSGRDIDDVTRYGSLSGPGLGESEVADATDFFAQLKPAPKADSRSRREEPPAFNPLNSYLSGWMTSQDYALLKSASATSVGPGAIGDGKTPAPASPTRENPYLQTLAPPPAPAPAPVAEKTPPPPAIAQGMVAPAPPPPATPPGHVPDFARPVSDEKYFKQLKRF